MSARPDTDNYLDLFLNDVPMLDVRAPVEYAKGAFPHTINIPLMDDEERHKVGLRYKERGQDSAIELGHELVCGDVKQRRVESWIEFTEANPQGYLYCFRGGLRSRTSQQWIREAGVDYPLVKGGYKAMRRFLIDQLEQQTRALNFVLIGGRTGCGKTHLLKRLPDMVDLEGIARHRGSSFGRMLEAQPSQIDFENQLSINLLKARHSGAESIYLEDEGRLIGRSALPESLKQKMAVSPIVLLEESVESRVDVVLQDYVIDMTRDYLARDGEEAGWDHFEAYLTQSLARIQKRLGGVRYQQLRGMMAEALAEQRTSGRFEGHREWIRHLIHDYYDPMYDYQLTQKQERVIARGSAEELFAQLNSGQVLSTAKIGNRD